LLEKLLNLKKGKRSPKRGKKESGQVEERAKGEPKGKEDE